MVESVQTLAWLVEECNAHGILACGSVIYCLVTNCAVDRRRAARGVIALGAVEHVACGLANTPTLVMVPCVSRVFSLLLGSYNRGKLRSNCCSSLPRATDVANASENI